LCYLELPEAAHGEVRLHLLGRVQGDPGEVLEVFQVLGIELGQWVLHIAGTVASDDFSPF